MSKEADIRPEQLKGLEQEFCAFLQDVSLKRRREKRYTFLGKVYGPRGLYLQWEEDSITGAIAAAQKLCPYISTGQIRKAVVSLMVGIFEDQAIQEDGTPDCELESIAGILDTSNVAQGIRHAVSSLNQLARPQVVFVPIEGLAFRVGPLIVGDVVFHPYSDGDESELDQALRDMGEDGFAFSLENLRDATCYAQMEIVGDDDYVREEAVRRTKEVVHILNLYLSSSRHQPFWASFRVAHVIVNRVLPDGPVCFSESFPVEIPIELNSERRQWMLQHSLEAVSGHFQSQSNSETAKRIRRAVTWYSKAVDADSPEEKYVNLAISLESLLVGDEGKGLYATTGSISQKIGERAAFLLGSNFDERVYLETATRDLYGERSAIVHRGKSVTREKLAQMDKLVEQVILAFLDHGFDAWPKFLKWVAQQKYGGVVDQASRQLEGCS